MGTRAIITKNGEPMIATHWDGYPESLGEDLKNMDEITTESIIKVAELHTIDFIEKSIGETVVEARIQELSKKHRLSVAEIKEGYRRGNIMSCQDYEICDISNYDDFAEYQYDIREDGIYCRELSGTWKEHYGSDEWEKIK